MGLDANFPVVTMNDLSGTVPIYNDDHLVVGILSGDRFRTNVTCLAQKWEGEWFYKQMTTEGNSFPSRNGWIPADRVHVTHNPHEPDPVPTCKNLSGCFKKAATGAAVTTAVGVGIRQWRRRGTRSRGDA